MAAGFDIRIANVYSNEARPTRSKHRIDPVTASHTTPGQKTNLRTSATTDGNYSTTGLAVNLF